MNGRILLRERDFEAEKSEEVEEVAFENKRNLDKAGRKQSRWSQPS